MTLLSNLSTPDPDPLVSVEWAAENLNNLKPVDGTWVLPNDEKKLLQGALPNTVQFDIDKIAYLSSNLAHMLPSRDIFSKAVGAMGLSENDAVLCYDRHGMFSAPRLWWTFKMFGHKKVYVLDGGFPAWVKAGLRTQPAASLSSKSVPYTPRPSLMKVTDFTSVKASFGNVQIVDARPSGRFEGTSPEPRAGLRSGHIPHSLSLPFGSLVTAKGHFKSLKSLATLTGKAGIDLTRPIITSCGSGITAAGLTLTFHRLGAKDIALYDGSWAEWGGSKAPITSQTRP